MFDSRDYSELAGSLATVAIACLGGPLAVAGAGLAEVVKYAQAQYAVDADTRDLRRRVTTEIRHWAQGEKLSKEDATLGLTLATETMAQVGLNQDVIAELRFDAEEAAQRVVEAARATDTYWGTEDHYAVAARAIQVTYKVLISQIRANEPVLVPAIQALRGGIDACAARVEAWGRSTQATLDDLASALISASTIAEVMGYLLARKADWDVSVWHPDQHAPSALERQLRARPTGRESSPGDRALTVDEALTGQRMLVVLGGPGSGKTWLARRYAREAAQTALSRLEDGADLDEVELPLFTTWNQWTKTPGGPRESLVAASFAAGLGHSDPDGTETLGRLERTFTQPGRKVLMVVDSLDEAADHAGQANRLRELTSLHGWRIVVTSRPAAWDATRRGAADRADGPRVVGLERLTYPEDVDAFIRAWFAADRDRGEALIEQIQARQSLARLAVVPLMLTFYCLLTEESAAADRPLPARRPDLYRRLIRRLLRSKWTAHAPGPDAGPDVDYCETLLRQWAWHAVHTRTTITGLGDWVDTFTQPTVPREGQSRAIDHVAPKVTEDDEGTITRRFVHRTILEHFVADHIATLNCDDAATLLLPHLWFDLDWKVTGPAAIAGHNRHHQGALFQQLLTYAVHPAFDPARQAAAAEFDRLLLAIAEESEPGEWTLGHQDVLNQCRVRNATSHPAVVMRSAHWSDSNPGVRAALLAVLPAADPLTVEFLVAVLLALEPTDDERAGARASLLAALPTTQPEAVSRLVAALTILQPTHAERRKARAALLAAVPAAEKWVLRELVATLKVLLDTEAERAEGRADLLAALPSAADPGAVGDLVVALTALQPTTAERATARVAVLDALPTAEKEWIVSRLAAALTALQPTTAERATACAALLDALPTAYPDVVVEDLVGTLTSLLNTDAQRATVRTAILDAVSTAAAPWSVRHLVMALTALQPTDGERAKARTSLLDTLPTAAAAGIVDESVTAFAALQPTDTERAKARTSLLDTLATAGDAGIVDALATALITLQPTDGERARARTSLLEALPTASVSLVRDVVAALITLEPTDAERARARTSLVRALPTASKWDVGALAAALITLQPTDGERARARTSLLEALPTADLSRVRDVVAALITLQPTDAERAKARTSLVRAMPTASKWDVLDLVVALTTLLSTDAERADARSALLTALPTVSDAEAVGSLVDALRILQPTDTERASARAALLASLPNARPEAVGDIVAVLRSVSPASLWVAWVANVE